jgi:hypothetical protein
MVSHDIGGCAECRPCVQTLVQRCLTMHTVEAAPHRMCVCDASTGQGMGGFRHPRGTAWEGLSIAPKGSRAYVVDELLVDADELMKAPTRTCALGACVAAHANVCARACVRALACVRVCMCSDDRGGSQQRIHLCVSSPSLAGYVPSQTPPTAALVRQGGCTPLYDVIAVEVQDELQRARVKRLDDHKSLRAEQSAS